MTNKKSMIDVGNGIYYSADMFSDYERLGLPPFDLQKFLDFQQKLTNSSPYLKDFPWLKTTKDTSNILPEVNTNVNTGNVNTGTDSSWFSGLTGENGIFSKNNLQTLNAVLGTIESFYNMYNFNRAYGLAKDQFNFQKQFATKNLANQIASYNTALTDRMQARAAMETGNKNAYDDQIAQRKLV